MSAEILRKAASEMRDRAARGLAWESEWDGDYAADKGWLAPPVALAVADWLDDTAQQLDSTHPDPACDLLYDGNAITVARAYLGESS